MQLHLSRLAAVGLSSTFIHAAALADEREITLNNITTALVPTAVLQGDREFNGNGPDVRSSVTLRIADDRRSIYADVYFHAKETTHDWSETEARWSRKVWQACPGQRVLGIRSPVTSEVAFRSVKGGFQIFGPGADFKELAGTVIDILDEYVEGDREHEILDRIREGTAIIPDGGNHVHVKEPEGDGPVRAFFIVGDTGGDDISDDDNGKDDTRIATIAFKPVRVDMEGPMCATDGSTGGTGAAGAAVEALVGGSGCASQVQGKLAWNYRNDKRWAQSNVERLCRGAELSAEPARCFQRVMHGGVNWGGGTRWSWKNAIDLCEGTRNAKATVSCFEQKIRQGQAWPAAIRQCEPQRRPVVVIPPKR